MRLEAILKVTRGGLDIRLGRSEGRFDGSIDMTLRQDGVSVGITKDGTPVFVRVRDAHKLDKTFARIMKKVDSEEDLSSKEELHVLKACTDKMCDVYLAYVRNLVAKLKKLKKALRQEQVELAKQEVKDFRKGAKENTEFKLAA